MFESIWRDIKETFRNGNMVNRLILINIGAFVLTLIIKIALQDTGTKILHLLHISGDLKTTIMQPWSIITYMFST